MGITSLTLDNPVEQNYSNMMNFGINKASNLEEISNQLNSGSYVQTEPWNFYGNNSQMNFSNTPFGGGGVTDPTAMQKAFGYTDKFGNKFGGWTGPAVGLAQAGLGAYLGFKQLSQGEDQLDESTRQFDLNYNAQKALINDQLNWQHNARLNNNPSYTGQLTQIA